MYYPPHPVPVPPMYPGYIAPFNYYAPPPVLPEAPLTTFVPPRPDSS